MSETKNSVFIHQKQNQVKVATTYFIINLIVTFFLLVFRKFTYRF